MLPAALIEPGAPIANAISTIRAVGWYDLAPVLAYGLFAAWKMPSSRQKRIMLWLAAICWLWIIIASLRAGGDAWDNPRYRTHFIIWIALLAGLALQWARKKQSPWLARWYAVEAAFLLPVTFWYLGRYWPGFPDLPFSWMIALIGLLAGAVLAGGWLWDRYAQRRVSSGPQPR
jgi:peptidoglycan/LPS O-acetylase OafA/YrhL